MAERADDLRAQRERVLAATGPDREIDRQIALAVDGWHHQWSESRRHGGWYWRGGPLDCTSTAEDDEHPPLYTASLDAAVALCGRIFPESRGSVDFGDWSGARMVAYLWRDHDARMLDGHAATPALALVAACLTAKIAELEAGNGHMDENGYIPRFAPLPPAPPAEAGE